MDVEKLKKINKLSVEFKKHGMADSSNDAISKASESVRDKEFQQVMNKTATHSEKSTDPGFDKQYQIMLERQNRQLTEEVNRLKQTVAAIQEEIKQIKNMPAQQQTTTQPKQEKQATLEKKKQDHPKQGEYTSEDVAVDKIFYYGKK